MAKPTRFTPKKTKHGWRVNIPPKFSETGRRQQLFYRTQKLALEAAAEFKAKVETFGAQARAIAPTLAEQATAAATLLAPYGATVLEAAEAYIAQRKRESVSRTVADAVALWQADCENLRDRTQGNYKSTGKRLSAALSDRLLATLKAEEIREALIPRGTPPTAAAGHVTRGKVFWNWCAEKGWCDAATIQGVKPPRAPRETAEIEILTPAEAERLLRTAQKHFPAAVALYAVQLFAGIRAEEVSRMEAAHVTANGIELGAEITKKGRRRHITPNATLKAWLVKHPFAPCPNWKRVDRACRYLAGWKLAPDPDLVPEELIRKTDTGREWPQNALRHSHASYAVAAGTTLETLLFEFGHSGTPAVLRQHYVGRASKKAALAFFAIRPSAKKNAKRPKLETVKEAVA